MDLPEVDITALHQAMLSAFADKFQGVHCAFYDRPGVKIPTPAILLEIEDILPVDPDDNGSEQLEVELHGNAYAVLSYKDGNKVAVKALAANILKFLHRQTWNGQPVQPASTGGAHPDHLTSPDAAKEYEVMRCEFTHGALLGESVWTDNGTPPDDIWLGTAPLIGPGHEGDYEPMTPP